jgi:ABC-2 type transport system permease protein
MSLRRIYGMILRYTYLMRRNFDRMSDAFYWPVVDLLLWGLTGRFAMQLAPDSKFIQIVITGLVFWYIVARIQGEISVNLLEEFWNDNLVNLFVSPLTFWEWVVSVLLNGIFKALLSFIFAAGLAFLLYKIAVLSYGIYLIPYLFLLSLTGWTMGYLISGLIFRYGTKIQFLGWTLVFIISPFSAVSYPVSVLPLWAQKVSAFIPTSYVFEGLRDVIDNGHFDLHKFFISLGLNIIYLVLSLIYIKNCFNKALNRGLINLN